MFFFTIKKYPVRPQKHITCSAYLPSNTYNVYNNRWIYILDFFLISKCLRRQMILLAFDLNDESSII